MFFLLLSNNAFAQIAVKGQLYNQNNKPLELVEMQIQNKDSLTIKSELTDELGKFSIATPSGIYVLQAKQWGKTLYKKTITLEQILDLGTIIIKETANDLQEVVVTSKKKLIERKVDRLIFNVENSISATGGDAIDALKVTPGIKVQNDKITMIGKSGMAVMVDDKLMQLSGDDLINFLKTISSDNIKSIEVITTPPAKYDAEGNSGIVNIKLKKAKKDSWSAGLNTAYKQARYNSERLGGNFMYQKKKLSLMVDLSGSNNVRIYTNEITYKYPTQNWKTNDYNKNNGKNINSIFNINYELTKKIKIGVQYLGSVSKTKVSEDYQTNVFNSNFNHLDQFYTSVGVSNYGYYNHSVNLNAINKIDTIGKQFTIDLDYYTQNNTKENPFSTTNTDYLTSKITDFHTLNKSTNFFSNYSAKIDFEMPYKFVNLNFGVKTSFTINDSNVNGNFYKVVDNKDNPYLIQSNIFNYKENNHALYISANRIFGKKWETKAGLRIEITQTKGFTGTETNKNNYTKYFPTAYFSYKYNESNTFTIDYARRIQRPSYSELNPARWYQNLNSYEVGNPFLQPSFEDNIELSHTYKDLLTSKISFSKTINGYGQLTVHDVANGLQAFIRQNFYDEKNVTFSESLNIPLYKWWDLVTSTSAYYGDTKTLTNILLPQYKGWGANFEINNGININESKTLTAQIDYYYDFRSRSEEVIVEPNSSFNIAIKYALLNKKLLLSLVANNIFKTDKVFAIGNTQGIVETFNQYYDSHYIRFSLNYKFGGSTNVEKREVGNQDERDRTN